MNDEKPIIRSRGKELTGFGFRALIEKCRQKEAQYVDRAGVRGCFPCRVVFDDNIACTVREFTAADILSAAFSFIVV